MYKKAKASGGTGIIAPPEEFFTFRVNDKVNFHYTLLKKVKM